MYCGALFCHSLLNISLDDYITSKVIFYCVCCTRLDPKNHICLCVYRLDFHIFRFNTTYTVRVWLEQVTRDVVCWKFLIFDGKQHPKNIWFRGC